jgi:hypothetical protein
MPRVNLYVSDDDAMVIHRARALVEGSHDSLSSLVAYLLRAHLDGETPTPCPHVTCHVCKSGGAPDEENEANHHI